MELLYIASLFVYLATTLAIPAKNSSNPEENEIIAQKSCLSDMGEKCMKKDELGPFEKFAKGGDPCFVYNKKRVNIKYF